MGKRQRGESWGKERNNKIGGCTLPLYSAIERIIDEELLQLSRQKGVRPIYFAIKYFIDE